MSDRQQSAFFLAIIFFFASGIGLVIYRQYDEYYQQKTEIDLETAAIPSVAPAKPTATSTPAQISGWKTYKNTEYGFEFEYPQNFHTISWLSNTGTLLNYTIVSNDFKFDTSSDASAGDTLSGARVDITVLKMNTYYKKVNCGNIGGYGANDCTEINFDNFPALSINSSFGGYQKSLFIKKGQVYFFIAIEYLDKANESQNYSQTFDKILTTFKFTN